MLCKTVGVQRGDYYLQFYKIIRFQFVFCNPPFWTYKYNATYYIHHFEYNAKKREGKERALEKYKMNKSLYFHSIKLLNQAL